MKNEIFTKFKNENSFFVHKIFTNYFSKTP